MGISHDISTSGDCVSQPGSGLGRYVVVLFRFIVVVVDRSSPYPGRMFPGIFRYGSFKKNSSTLNYTVIFDQCAPFCLF